MDNRISPRYQMSIVQDIVSALNHLFNNDTDIKYYLEKWIIEYDSLGNNCNFYLAFKDSDFKTIDVEKTLHSIDGETLLKIAIDLGVETPDFIPSLPFFRNELKSNYKTASQTFEKAFHQVESDPDLAIGLANSALESIMKEILADKRLEIKEDKSDTTEKLIKKICNALFKEDKSAPISIRTISSSLISCASSIEKLRSTKTTFHGKTDKDIVISDSTYAYFVVNVVSSVGLFLLNYYKELFSDKQELAKEEMELPF